MRLTAGRSFAASAARVVPSYPARRHQRQGTRPGRISPRPHPPRFTAPPPAASPFKQRTRPRDCRYTACLAKTFAAYGPDTGHLTPSYGRPSHSLLGSATFDSKGRQAAPAVSFRGVSRSCPPRVSRFLESCQDGRLLPGCTSRTSRQAVRTSKRRGFGCHRQPLPCFQSPATRSLPAAATPPAIRLHALAFPRRRH